MHVQTCIYIYRYALNVYVNVSHIDIGRHPHLLTGDKDLYLSPPEAASDSGPAEMRFGWAELRRHARQCGASMATSRQGLHLVLLSVVKALLGRRI